MPEADVPNLLTMQARQALNRVAKWRTLLTGWQLGTRPKGDPEGDAVRDHRELSLLLRVEVNAAVSLLLAKGIITEDDWARALIREADAYEAALEKRWPGVRATDAGLSMDKRAAEWMQHWKP